MKRILVSIPDELHELLREFAARNGASMSKVILAAIEDTYEDELDAISGERALAEHLADPSTYVSWDEVKTRLRAQAEASLKRSSSTGRRGRQSQEVKEPRTRKKVAVQG